MPIPNPGPECGARTPGFWCQNQFGKNPNLTAEEFAELEACANRLLEGCSVDVSEAVCDTSNQFLRHLSALALNLCANLISHDTPLLDQSSYDTVCDVFDAALAACDTQPEALKDLMDGINNNANTDWQLDLCCP